MRSRELASLNNKLGEYNTHYSHFKFIYHQFKLDNEAVISTNMNKYTDEVYINNEYSKQFKVKLDAFPGEVDKSINFFRQSIFLLTYFQIEVYLKEIYNLGKQFNEGIPEIKPKASAVTQ